VSTDEPPVRGAATTQGGPHDYGEEADEGVAGLAAERTEMAWSRTGFAMIGCGVVIAKGLPALSWSSTQRTVAFPEASSHPILGGAVLSIGVAVWLLGHWSARRRRHAGGRHVATWSDLAPTAFGTAAIGFAALVLAVYQPN
jgi:uncharacterized membrane protein YidH (DUF202 family)